jgi:hypothetical protein
MLAPITLSFGPRYRLMDDNQLHGTVPSWLGSQSQLSIIYAVCARWHVCSRCCCEMFACRMVPWYTCTMVYSWLHIFAGILVRRCSPGAARTVPIHTACAQRCSGVSHPLECSQVPFFEPAVRHAAEFARVAWLSPSFVSTTSCHRMGRQRAQKMAACSL